MKKVGISIIALGLMAFGAIQLKKNTIPSSSAIEVVIYTTREGTSEKEAVELAQSVNGFISRQDGFISRNLYRTEDGRWIDIVSWESIEKAMAAGEKAMNAEETQKFFQIIDESNMIFLHGKKIFTLEP